MVTRLTNYTKQFWILLSTDDMDTLGAHNGDEAIVIDQDKRYVFDEDYQTWHQIPMSGGGGGGGVTVNPLSITENGTYTAPSGTAYSPVTVNVQGSGSNSITIDVTSFQSYDSAQRFASDLANRIGVTYFVFEAVFINNTNNSRAGIWIGGAKSSYGINGLVKRVGGSGDFSYGIDVYAGSSITINYMEVT